MDNSAETRKINNEFAERSNKGRSKPEEKFSEQNIEQNDKTQIQTESQEDDEETLTTDEVIPHNSSNISSDLVAQTEEDDLLQTYDRDRTDSFEQDKHLQHSIEKSQTSNQSTENRSGILENETTTQREETGEENLISSYEDLRKINRDEEVLSETVSVNKDEGNKTQNETQEDDEESLANKEVIPNDSSSATLDLVSKTENVPNTEIKKNTEHGEENNESFKEFSTKDLNSPDILENETTKEQKEHKLEKISNTSDNFRESMDDEVSTQITLEIKEDFTAIDQHALSAPEEVKTSIATLADYLLNPANSDSKKARVIFIWIADNIRYNTEGYFSGQYGGTDAESVLLSGTSVCSGYANLFEALCTQDSWSACESYFWFFKRVWIFTRR